MGAISWSAARIEKVRAAAAQSTEVGPLEDNKLLQLQIQPGRIDWVLFPQDNTENNVFPSLGEFEKPLKLFRELISKWIPESPPLTRLAFGTVLSIKTPNQSESVLVLSRFLPFVKLNWLDVQDFNIQLNQPRPSCRHANLGAINRLIKWQAALRKAFVATISLGSPSSPLTTKEETAVLCELDISTPALPDPAAILPRENVSALFEELLENASDIVVKGGVL